MRNQNKLTLVIAVSISLALLITIYYLFFQSFPVHFVYSSQFDGNQIWVVHYDNAGNKISKLVSPDITNFVTGKLDYHQEGIIYLQRLHNLSDEPNVQPYYVFEYIQEKLEFSGQPIYYSSPIDSEAFAVGVNHLGSGWELLRETLLIFDASSSPQSRFEQVYRGPDNQLYIYVPGAKTKQLLQDAINNGYNIYKLSEFQ